MKNKLVLSVILGAAALASQLAGPAMAESDIDTYQAADAGSLGVVAVDLATTYCAADAGSLRHPDPVGACS